MHVSRFLSARRSLCLGACAAAFLTPALGAREAQPAAQPLPAAVEAALQRAKVPREALAAVVIDVEGAKPRLSLQGDVPANPASVMKLVTTYAALEMLGPAFTWETPVYLDAQPQGGSLRGNVYIKGQGDPRLVVERLWLLMRRLRAQGISVIVGDIVLDRSAFAVPAHDAALFDGEPWRPYNVAPDALLLNFKSLTLGFVPDEAAGVARVSHEPPLAQLELPDSVPLAPAGTACGDWRAGLRADFTQASRLALAGSYPAACGERQWSVAPADPQGYAARAIEGMWRELGGKLTGQVRDGRVPAGLAPAFSTTSPALAEVVRDINKYSNNVMTQQLFLTLALQRTGQGSPQAARDVLGRWWDERVGLPGTLVVDNGAGLSREARISARALARMLQLAWASPVMPEFVSSMPIMGVDGTLRRRPGQASGTAHLKTGTLRDVTAIGGYVLGASGRRHVLVAIVNHPNAPAARPALDALVDWARRDTEK
ncbi:MAG TPA: D-alanyl-D-alanine carboxypeptidase/D-alanyl-D-alanine-endopeptidase [Comamonadaceae bacterium]|uniref:D-alanyl-D-alanine carboxypeptidase/D-alanyl-D-alanine endopeptidase n=1 Tax=Pulveribacter sp. TaxID=2678893 RepID=UPI000EE0A835|nr:D-alanyl-D-alanine carboxypeptidase/D-alanyl-D-alanine-endopeptidase [Pulveribacter sp.]HCL86841.1 D-alanyl-D-alanine carboxypeptidase/D-alanyl-D-alanine-endopeptidase [Comamonadaceae bacterium]